MSEKIDSINGTQNQGQDPDFGVPVLVEGQRTYSNYVTRALLINSRAREAFISLQPDDSALLKAAERWKRASISLERWAGSLFNKVDVSEEEKHIAIEIMAHVDNDCAERSEWISRNYDLLEEKNPEWCKELEEAEKADLKAPSSLKFGQKAILPGAAKILSRFPKLA